MSKRTQSELLIKVLKVLRQENQAVSIRKLAVKSNVTWRFARKTVKSLKEAGLLRQKDSKFYFEGIEPKESILDMIGNTPLVKIRKMNPNKKVELYAKLESFNPFGSVKDRMAKYMIEAAEKEGIEGRILLEATSGNTGIALSAICAVKGHKIVLVMPESMSIERRKILKAYGAEIVLTQAEKGTDGAIDKARLIAKSKGYLFLDQFSNENNVLAHYETTGPEIWSQTNGKITHLVAGMGSCGTIMGIGKYLKEKNPKIKIVGVEPEAKTPIPGLKNMSVSYMPKILDMKKIDEKTNVTAWDAFKTARLLAREEGIFAGASSGAALHAALEKIKKMKKGLMVVIIPDSGDKYLSTGLYY